MSNKISMIEGSKLESFESETSHLAVLQYSTDQIDRKLCNWYNYQNRAKGRADTLSKIFLP